MAGDGVDMPSSSRRQLLTLTATHGYSTIITQIPCVSWWIEAFESYNKLYIKLSNGDVDTYIHVESLQVAEGNF